MVKAMYFTFTATYLLYKQKDEHVDKGRNGEDPESDSGSPGLHQHPT